MAIPKIIHYCWFGEKKMSKTANMCLDSWRKHCPDYKIMLWNESNSPLNNDFVKTAYEQKKYAFVADYVRTWALDKYGGVYMDTDMLLIKNIDDLLNQEMFLGYEQKERLYINVAMWGSIPDHQFLKNILDFYASHTFDINKIFYYTIPSIVTREYKQYKGNNSITVYDYDWFYSFPGEMKRHKNFMDYLTANSVSVHLWDMSWLTMSERLKNFLKRVFCKKQIYVYT